MTVSNVHTFNLTRDELIREALELTATIDIGSPTDPNILESCARSLNLYIKAWQKRGLFLHTYQPAQLELVVGQDSYLLGPAGAGVEADGLTPIVRPLKIIDVRYQSDTNELPVTSLSMSEYMELTTKDSPGRPTQYAYDPQLDNSRIYFWPVPSVAETIVFNYQKPVDDFTTSEDTAAIPTDWLLPLTLGLAYHIAPKLQVPLSEQKALQARYEEAMQYISDFEEVSFFIEPG